MTQLIAHEYFNIINLQCSICVDKGHNTEHGSDTKSRVHRKIINRNSQIKCLKTSASNKVIVWCENNIYFIYLEKKNI